MEVSGQLNKKDVTKNHRLGDPSEREKRSITLRVIKDHRTRKSLPRQSRGVTRPASLLLFLCLCFSGSVIRATTEPRPHVPPPRTSWPTSSIKNAVVMVTNKGVITIRLFPSKAPKTVANFLRYVKAGFYRGTIFHRVVKSFVIQGGGYDKAMNKKQTKAPIANEAANGLKNKRGTVAMARTMNPNSATSQFFINLKDNAYLNAKPGRAGSGYCVFGKVISGMDVVDRIGKVSVGKKGSHRHVPNKPVAITRVRAPVGGEKSLKKKKTAK